MPRSSRLLAILAPLSLCVGCTDLPAEVNDTGGPTDTTTTNMTSTTVVGPTTTMVDTTTTAVDTASSTGAIAAPEIEVSIDASPVASGEGIKLPDEVAVADFGSPVEVTIENVGTADLAINGVALTEGDDAHFVIDDGRLAAVVPPGDSTTFRIAFVPTNGGIKRVSIEIDNNDADESPYQFELSGHTTENTYRRIEPPTSPPGRFNATLVDLRDGRLLLFGGRSSLGARLGDTWIFDVEAETWTEINSAASPPPRDAHGMAYAGRGTVVLFGGVEFNADIAYDDTWAFNAATEEWTELMPAGGPTARFKHSMVGVADGSVVLFGGRVSFGNHQNDTWMYDVAANTWTDLAPSGGIGIRSSMAMGFDGAGMITVFGGYDDDNLDPGIPVDETWRYDVAGNSWAQGSPSMTPGDRFVLPGAHFANGTFIVFSGKIDCCEEPRRGTFAYDPEADNWTNLQPRDEPAPRFSHALAYVQGRNKAIIFGGDLSSNGPSGATNEMWEFVGLRP